MKPHARRLALVVSAAAMLGACAELRDMMRESQRPEVVAEGAGMAEAAGKPATAGDQPIAADEIGRASCRERV